MWNFNLLSESTLKYLRFQSLLLYRSSLLRLLNLRYWVELKVRCWTFSLDLTFLYHLDRISFVLRIELLDWLLQVRIIILERYFKVKLSRCLLSNFKNSYAGVLGIIVEFVNVFWIHQSLETVNEFHYKSAMRYKKKIQLVFWPLEISSECFL